MRFFLNTLIFALLFAFSSPLLAEVTLAKNSNEFTLDAWNADSRQWLEESQRLQKSLKKLNDSNLRQSEVREIAMSLLPQLELFSLKVEQRAQLALLKIKKLPKDFSEAQQEALLHLLQALRKTLDNTKINRSLCLKSLDQSLLAQRENFGESGIARANAEAQLLHIEQQLYFTTLVDSASRQISKLKLSLIPLILALFQSLLLIFGYRTWKRWLKGVTRNQLNIAQHFLIQMQTSLSSLLLLLIILIPFKVIFPEEIFNALQIILEGVVFSWILFQASRALILRYTMNYPDAETCHRIWNKSFRLTYSYFGLVIICWGAAHQYLTSCYTLQSWMYSLLTCFSFLVLFGLLKIWKGNILAQIALLAPEHLLARVFSFSNKGLLLYLSIALAAPYFLAKGLKQWFFMIAMDIEFLRPLMSTLFRAEASRQSEDELKDLSPAELLPSIESPCLIDDYAEEELQSILSQKQAFTLVCGEQGMGKSFFLKKLTQKIERKCILIKCQRGSLKNLLLQLKQELNIPEEASQNQLITALQAESITICIDDVHLLIQARIGGLDALDKLCKLIRKSGSSSRWILSMNRESCNFLQRSRDRHMLIDSLIELPSWTEQQIEKLIKSRLEAQKTEVDFAELLIPKQFEKPDARGNFHKDKTFFRMLRDYCEGNPRIALHFWQGSLYVKDQQTAPLQVRLFRPPKLEDLDNLPLLTLFNLRTIVQMCELGANDLKSCSAQAENICEDSLRLLINLGVLRECNGLYRIHRQWFRAVTTILRRRYLLSK